jgi:hypothetical protein
VTDLVVLDALPASTAEAPELAMARAGAEQILRSALDTLDQLVATHPTDLAGQAHVYVLVARLKGDLSAISDRVAVNLCTHMPSKQLVVEGLGVFERHKASNTTAWENDALWRWISSSAIATGGADPDTGELAGPDTAAAVERAVDAAVSEAKAMQSASPGWRKTALRARDINPDDVSTTTYGKSTVQFTPPQGGTYQ